MRQLKIIIFGNEKCPQCVKQKEEFQKINVPFEFVDALAKENENVCDHFGVDEIPHMVCLFEDTLHTLFSHIGFIDGQVFMNHVVHKLSNGRKSNFQPLKGRGAASPDASPARRDEDLLK